MQPALPPGAAHEIPALAATIVVFNGAGHDHWMEHLLESTARPQRTAIEAAGLIGVGEGDDPHVWYDPRTIPAVARALAEALTTLDPEGATAAAQLLTARLLPGVLAAAGLAVVQAWLGVVIALQTDWPTSFCITAIGALVYLAALGRSRGGSAVGRTHIH